MKSPKVHVSNAGLPCATILDGNMPIPHPTQVGWKLEDVAGAYATTPTSKLAHIYEMLMGKNEPVTTVKELSERSGRPIVIFIQPDDLRFYTPQRYQSFSPVALTYSPISGLFGMAASNSWHHDFVCYLCAYGVRIENVADVPHHMLYPYLSQAKVVPDGNSKLELLRMGRLTLEAVAMDGGKGIGHFNTAILEVLENEKQLSETHAIFMLKTHFAGGRLSDIDAEGAEYATLLSDFLNRHGGDSRLATDLLEASTRVSKGLDEIMVTANGVTLTDELLGSMKSTADMVAMKFTEHMSSYNFSIENDTYPWKTISAMESGNVSATSARHEAFNRYREEKLLRYNAFAALTHRTDVTLIDLNSTVETILMYCHTVADIQHDLLQLVEMGGPLPDTSTLQTQLKEMKVQGYNFNNVVLSLQKFMKVAGNEALSSLEERAIWICKEFSLQKVMCMYTDIPQIVGIGKALQIVGVKNNLQNARFGLTPGEMSVVSRLLQGSIEGTLKVKIVQGTVVTDLMNPQPMGDLNTSPFTNALKDWDELKTKVESVAQNMTLKMVKFANFSAVDLKPLLSMNLHPVHEYERFANDVKHWTIIDISKCTVIQRMQENLKFIRIVLAAFPDQDNSTCASFRLFTAHTDLTYTLNENESLLNAFLTHTTYGLIDNFNETQLVSLDVATIAQTYTRDMICLRVRNLETFIHYLLRGYEENGEYAAILCHLTDNSDRVALLKHIVENHVTNRADGEGDMERVQDISKTYMLNFVIPYKAKTACLDKIGCSVHVKRLMHSSFLAKGSVLRCIVAERMLRGADVEDPKVKVEELASALQPQRLYRLTHFGDSLGWGHYICKGNAHVPIKEWREKLMISLAPKPWSVDMSEIIKLHSGVYNPEQLGRVKISPKSALFLGHEDNSMFVWSVKALPHKSFPKESPNSLMFGGVPFRKASTPVKTVIHSALSCHGEVVQYDEPPNLQEAGQCDDQENKEKMKPPLEEGNVYDMGEIAETLGRICPLSPPLRQLSTLSASEQIAVPANTTWEEATTCPSEWSGCALPTEQVCSSLGDNTTGAIGLGRKTPTHRPNYISTQIETTGNHKEKLFVTASANPWRVLRGRSCEDIDILRHLMRTRIKLSDSDSEEVDQD